MTKYVPPAKEFLDRDDLKNRRFQCDSLTEMRACYASLWNWRKRNELNFYLFCNADDNSVIITKEPIQATMTYTDDVDTSAYEQHKMRYGAKYTKMFTDFLEAPTTNREINCATPTQTRSCRDSMARLIKKFDLEDTIRVSYDIRKKTVLLTRKGGPIHV